MAKRKTDRTADTQEIIIPHTPTGPRPAQTPPATTLPMNGSLSSQNESALAAAIRRFRELLLDAQQHRAEGRVIMDAFLSGGQCTRAINVRPQWSERL